MPKFPTYRGELPTCLNPLNPRHWLLALSWVFFRPTALKCYLYQADPELYHAGPGKNIFRTWQVPAYRNLYVTAVLAMIAAVVIIGLPYTLFVNWLQDLPMDWLQWAFSVAGGVAGGVGALRLILYPFHLALAMCSGLKGVRHPLEWDEFVIISPDSSQSFMILLQPSHTSGF